MAEILILYYSVGGSVRRMAEFVAEGVERVAGAMARLRTVPNVAPVTQIAAPAIPPEGAPYCELRDLESCAGLALGSPTRFATWRRRSSISSRHWRVVAEGALAGKPSSVFTSTASMHGRKETTLVSMMLPPCTTAC